MLTSSVRVSGQYELRRSFADKTSEFLAKGKEYYSSCIDNNAAPLEKAERILRYYLPSSCLMSFFLDRTPENTDAVREALQNKSDYNSIGELLELVISKKGGHIYSNNSKLLAALVLISSLDENSTCEIRGYSYHSEITLNGHHIHKPLKTYGSPKNSTV
ncbi:MAG: hypothetical protein ACE365_01345 [Gammaproteobacteria bacterium]